MPVKCWSWPARAFLLEALHVAALGHCKRRVDEDLEEFTWPIHLSHHLALRPNGEMSALITISPASVINLATSPTRRMFSTRSASLKMR